MRKTIRICDRCKDETCSELFTVIVRQEHRKQALFKLDLCKHCLAEFKKWVDE